MKKILVCLFVFASILLVSCGKKDELEPRRDNPHTDNVELLDLNSVKDGNAVIDTDTSAANYYLVKASANLNKSLFVFETELDEVFEYHLNRKETITEVNISALTFSSEIEEAEASAIISTVFAENGVNKDKLGLANDINTSASGATTANIKDFYNAYKNENVKNNKLITVYLPTYTERYVDGSFVLGVYVMVPVYYEIVSDNVKASNAFDGINTPELKFCEDDAETAINESLLLASN